MSFNLSHELDSLKEKAIRVDSGMITVTPGTLQENTLNFSNDHLYQFNGCYSLKNSVICFIHLKQVYVIPYTLDSYKTVLSFGFRQEDFEVPFSSGDYPKNAKEKWDLLCKEAQK